MVDFDDGYIKTSYGWSHEWYKHVEWLSHSIKPKHVQLEAISRSYHGIIVCTDRHAQPGKTLIGMSQTIMPGWAHFMEMRLGKSYTGINEFALFNRDYDIERLLIFAPNKFKYDWKIEIEKFGLDIPVVVFESKNRDKVRAFIKINPRCIVVVNYEALIYEETVTLLKSFVADGRAMIMADESILIKNRSTEITKNALLLRKSCPVRRILTGKPSSQGPHDYHSQLQFIGAFMNTSIHAFKGRYCKTGGYMGRQVVGVQNEDELKDRLDKCSFIAKRRNWVDNFEPTYEIRKNEMTREQKEKYKTMEEEFIAFVGEQEVAAEQVITKYMKLAQISSGFIIDEDGNHLTIVPFHKVPKVADLLDMLNNEITSKVIVVGVHNYVLDQCVETFKNFNPAIIRGETHMKQMGLNVTDEKLKFNNDPTCRVLIGQIKAIKYGHTLTGTPSDPCTVIAYLENSYSLDDRSQSEQRNVPQVQTDSNIIIDFVGSPLENKVIKALQRKESISEAVLSFVHNT